MSHLKEPIPARSQTDPKFRRDGRYRPDVDGLRAVAVILVILYHLDRSFAPGGFVGVDIFFVISGFVVTGSILASPMASPLESLARFWRRRILRIVPVLLVTVLISCLLTAMISPPFPKESYNSNFRTGISAVLGLGNFYLYRTNLDYFAADTSTNPFVHTWSLGVEEQFYFVFAIIFIGVIGLLPNRRTRVSISIVAMAILGAVSYTAFFWTAPTNPSITYYLIPFRFWEIAVGSGLAFFEERFPEALRPKRAGLAIFVQLFSTLCLIAIVWLVRSEGGFPWVQITVAVSAAVLLIGVGKQACGPIIRLLSARVVVSIGLISYSLYLWHYPILLFWRTNVGLHQASQILLALLAILLAAISSYWTVERTFRHSSVSFYRVLLPSLMAVILAEVGFAWLVQERPGLFYVGSNQLWATDWLPPTKDFAYAGNNRIVGSKCDVTDLSVIPARLPDSCVSINAETGSPKRTLLVVGDSHAFADWGMAAAGSAAGLYRFAALGHDGCAPWSSQDSARSTSCRTYWDNMPGFVRNTLHQDDAVLISFFWSSEEMEATGAAAKVAQIAKAAQEVGAEVIVEAPLPVFERPAYLCTPEWYRTNYEGCLVSRSQVEERRNVPLTKLRHLLQEHGNVRKWDPLNTLCPAFTCDQFRDGKPLFRDTNHLSYYGSKTLGPAFIKFWRGGSE